MEKKWKVLIASDRICFWLKKVIRYFFYILNSFWVIAPDFLEVRFLKKTFFSKMCLTCLTCRRHPWSVVGAAQTDTDWTAFLHLTRSSHSRLSSWTFMLLALVTLVVRAMGSLPFFSFCLNSALKGGFHKVCSWVSYGMSKIFELSSVYYCEESSLYS